MTGDVPEIVGATEPFASLSDEALDRLTGIAQVVTVPAGHALFDQGEAPDGVFVLLEGAVAIGTVSEEGQETRFADLGPGALFGEFAAIDEGPRTAGATATADARLWRLPTAAFREALTDVPGFAAALLRVIVAKLREADVELEDRRVLSLEARLAKFLRAHGSDGTLEMTQAQIADRLGVTREAVNRRLRALEGAGVIALRRGRVAITAPDRL